VKLYRLKLRPRSPWRTPWQADTLTGALCSIAARAHGPEFLTQRLIRPMLSGSPPFVLSDAFPGDLLPLPVPLRLAKHPPDADRKAIKRGRWLPRENFLALRAAAADSDVPWTRILPDSTVFCAQTTQHSTLARDSDASLEEGGLFSRPDTCLPAAQTGPAELTLYFRAADDEAAELLMELLYSLALVGFGADTATGRGQFEIAGDAEQAADIDRMPPASDGVIVLSTFQPAPNDPTDGLWEAFPKFAKLGPDLGLSDVRKHTLIMFRPGACFRCNPATPFIGRALSMDLILPAEAAAELRARQIEVIHPAFGLSIPACFSFPERFTS
jgi:CRISPR-associated protein Csm4